MAASTVWAIDVGHSALRAVKARRLGDRVQVLSFDVVEYRQSLAAPGVDRDVQIQQAAHTFVSRNDLRGCSVAVVIPAPSALVRFIQLPPVDRSAIPDIVQYEARQQIPFSLEEVCWDHAAIDRGFIPGEEVEVGLFALRKEIAFSLLNCLLVGGLDPDVLQIPPVALFNFTNFDRHPGRDAVLVMDMGVENTHLLCLSEDTVWTRSLPIGGNTFTLAIQKALGISYQEAEQEKLNARKSPRAKEIAEAISQPMSRFIEEVQRSLGYFRSLHADTRVTAILAMGHAFRLPGLARYVQEASGLEIHGLDSLENYDLSQARNANYFKQHAASFPVALGLAAQVLGIAGTLDTTMLPTEVLRRKVLSRKKPYAAAAAAVVLAFVIALFAGEKAKSSGLLAAERDVLQPALATVQQVEDLQRRMKAVSVDDKVRAAQEIRSVFEGRLVQGQTSWQRIFDELTKPIPPEPNNEHIWLRAVGASYVPVSEAAADLVEARTGQGGRSERPRGAGGAGTRRSRGPQGPRGGRMGQIVMPEQVLSVVIMGEAKHPDREAFVDREFVSKLSESPVFSFVKMKYSGQVQRWVDETGTVVGDVAQRGRGGALMGRGVAEGAAPEGLTKVDYTQFVIQAFVDPEGKLKKAVEDEKKRMAEMPRMGPQP